MTTRRSTTSGRRDTHYRQRTQPSPNTKKRVIGIIAAVIIVAVIIGVFAWNKIDSGTMTAPAQSAYALAEPTDVQVTLSANKKKANISWKGQEQGASFQIQQSTNSLFVGAKTLEVRSSDDSAYVARGLDKSKTYYFRIRAISGSSCSKWVRPSGSAQELTATMSDFKTGFNLVSAAGQDINQFGVFEGACSDGKYLYCALADETSGQNQAKIVKVRISSGKVAKVSDALDLDRANDITYNSSTKQLVVTACEVSPWNITVVSPKSLKAKQTLTLSLPESLPGATKGNLAEASGIDSLAYNKETGGYIALLGTTHALAELDADFNFTRYITIGNQDNCTLQGIEIVSGNIVVCKSDPNVLDVYNMNGEEIEHISIPNDYELENASLASGSLYVGIYCSPSDSQENQGGYIYKLDTF